MSSKPHLHGLIIAFALLLSACAGQATRTPAAAEIVEGAAAEVQAEAPVETTIDAGSGTGVDTFAPAVNEGDRPAVQATGTTDATPPANAVSDPTSAEDDFTALYGNPEYDPVADPSLPPGVVLPASYDPWEPFNRRMHAINNFIDRSLAKPVARAYMKVVPRPVRLGVSNFFNNLGQPSAAINALLQGRPTDAAISMLRFSVNLTLGVGGVFDPASRMKIPYRDEDFGQTLAVWGWRQSRYVELPVFGPRTVRDLFGMAGDSPLSPLNHVNDARTVAAVRGLQLVDIRTRLFSVDAMREGVADEYALYRDAWLQRRNYQISSGLRSARQQQPDNLPDCLLEEEENPTVPVDAIPINP